MLHERIRRPISALLISSILSSSFSPVYATSLLDSDSEDESYPLPLHNYTKIVHIVRDENDTNNKSSKRAADWSARRSKRASEISLRIHKASLAAPTQKDLSIDPSLAMLTKHLEKSMSDPKQMTPSKFKDGEDNDTKTFKYIAHLPQSHRAVLINALLNFKGWNAEALENALSWIHRFDAEDCYEGLKLLMNFTTAAMNNSSKNTTELSDSDKKSSASNNPDATSTPDLEKDKDFQPLRLFLDYTQEPKATGKAVLDILRQSISFMTSNPRLKNLSQLQRYYVTNLFASFSTSEERQECAQYLNLQLPQFPQGQVFRRMTVAALLPAGHREQLYPILSECFGAEIDILCLRMHDDSRLLGLFLNRSLAKVLRGQTAQDSSLLGFYQNIKEVLKRLRSDDQSTSLEALANVTVADQPDVLEKSTSWMSHYVKTAILFTTLAAYSRAERAERFGLINDFIDAQDRECILLKTIDAQKRGCILLETKNLSVAQIKSLFEFLAPVPQSERYWAATQLIQIPENYRSLLLDVKDLKAFDSRTERMTPPLAREIYEYITSRLKDDHFERHTRFIKALKGESRYYYSIEQFRTLSDSEDPVEIAESLGVLKCSFQEATKLTKAQRTHIVSAVKEFMAKAPIDERDQEYLSVFDTLKTVDHNRIPILLVQCLRLIKGGHVIIWYDIHEILETLAALPVAEADELVALVGRQDGWPELSLPDSRSAYSAQWEAAQYLLKIPAPYRPILADLAGLEKGPQHTGVLRTRSNFDYALRNSEQFHQRITTHLAAYPIETQAKIAHHFKGFDNTYDGTIFEKFATLPPQEDPVEIAESMGILGCSFEDAQSLPKGQRTSIARSVKEFVAKTKSALSPYYWSTSDVDNEDQSKTNAVFDIVKKGDRERISELLAQACVLIKKKSWNKNVVVATIKELVEGGDNS